MIANRVGAIVVWAVAAVLALVLVLDLRRDQGVPDRALAPGFDASRVTALAWDGGAFPIRIEKERDGVAWKWKEPFGEADRQAIEDLFAALRGARWHRRADAEVAGPLGQRLVLEGDAARQFALGAQLGEQQWLVTGEHAVLVDRWVVAALFPEPLALRRRKPLGGAATATSIEVGSFELKGTPRKLTKLAGMPIDMLARPELVADLERALAELTVLALPRAKIPIDTNYRGTRFALGGTLIAVEAGKCPEPGPLHAIIGPSIGPGCVSNTAFDALLAAAAVFDVDDKAGRLRSLVKLVDPRPAAIEPTAVTLADGSVLDLAKRPRVRDPKSNLRDADPARVTELLAVLATPGEPIAVPAAAPVGHIEVRANDVAIAIDVFPGGVIARHGEPVALRVGEGSYAILTRGGPAYADPTLWLEEPLTIRRIQIGDANYERGSVIGSWSRDGKPADAKRLDALATALATLRSLGSSAKPTASRPVNLVTAPPVGAPATHAFTLGRAGTLCVATIDGVHHAIEPQICELADAL